MAPEKLTEYERKRLENIKRNEEMLSTLKVHAKASDLSAAATKRQRVQSKSYKVSPQKKPEPQTPIMLRRSLRVQRVPPDSKGLSDDFVVSIDKPLKYVRPVKSSAPDMRGPLGFKDAYLNTGSYASLLDAILTSAKKPHFGEIKEEFDASLGYDRNPTMGDSVKEEVDGVKAHKDENLGYATTGGVRDFKTCQDEGLIIDPFDSVKGVIKTEKSEFRSSVDIGSLNLKPENVARIMPGRIMQIKFLPCTDVRMVVAGNKFGNVAFWNLDCQQEEDDGIYLYHTHSGPISGIVTQQSCLSKIFTSCYDGLIRLMDTEKEVFDLVYSSEYAIFSLSQQPNNLNNLYLGEGQGELDIWDVRTKKSSSEWLLHEARINTIDFNSQNSNIMVTSSTDGTACIWDLRSMASYKPKPMKVLSHKKAVHSAYFSPSGSSLATTSLDDTVGIWSGVNLENTLMIHHNNQTGRWISSFRAIWSWDDSYIFVGNMARSLDVISPAQGRIITTLQSPDASAIPCRFHAHSHLVGTLAGATGGGQVYIWTSD